MRSLHACLSLSLILVGLLGLAVLAWRESPVSSRQTEPAAEPASAFHVEPYLQLPTPDGMTIMWETREVLPGQVEYGPTPELGQVVAEQAPARVVKDPKAPGRVKAVLHQVRLEGLQPGTPYFYRVRTGTLVSKVHRFRTAPPPGTRNWRMALYGDSRSFPKTHRKVVEQIAKHDVDLILHTGDIVLNGKDYDLWRREFFEPLAPIAGSVPWVSTIGNHEADADNYFSYAALPGNERYFGFDYANAHIICLDSNGWMQKDGRAVRQREWMQQHFPKPREATWTFVAFHHPLFSAHATRPINSLRWEWAPLFLDPAWRVDAVLNGHDHFYARTYPLTFIPPASGEHQPPDPSLRGVLFLTSAGGGAWLYPIKQRDYIAKAERVHHFTLFEFDGDRIDLSAIDITGRVIDRYVLSKQPTPPEELCAYEVEELKQHLRQALAAAPAVELQLRPLEAAGPTEGTNPRAAPNFGCEINTHLDVKNPFRVPSKGTFRWQASSGWTIPELEAPFAVQPGKPLRIPLQAKVAGHALGTSPLLIIEFEPGRFRNRVVEVYPFKLTGPAQVPVVQAPPIDIDGQLEEPPWQQAHPMPLLASGMVSGGRQPPDPPIGEHIQLTTDGDWLYVAARLTGKVPVTPRVENRRPSGLILFGTHVRVELHDGQQTHTFALSPEQIPYYAVGGKMRDAHWRSAAAGGDDFWTAELAIPLQLFADRSKLRINVVHKNAAAKVEAELRPAYVLDAQHPDLLPAWKSGSNPDRFARLVWQ